ncbi:MAG: helix-turn-helix domain-containing protein [Clostridia bacterium]|nr:helix-turn-helix domain-containing protein [Clostridia bacterium]
MAIYSDEKIEFFQRATRDSSFVMPQSHFHNKHELYFLEKGSTKYFIGSEIYLLEAGDLIFVPKGCFHKTATDQAAERLLFLFDDDFVGGEYLHYVEGLKSNRLIRIPPDQLYKLKEIFRKIEQENKQRADGYLEMERLYLRQLLILISRYRLTESHTELSDSYRLIQNAATYICENYGSELSLELLSRKYALSRSHFSKLFKEVTGVGLNEYITITRITAAEKMLAKKNLSITEVASACGFNDSNYFAAVFKRHKGITPKKYSLMNR